MQRLLILWLALIGCDRIDFFNGEGDFVLTPFLLLSFVLVFLFLLTHIASIYKIKEITINNRINFYMILSIFFLLIILFSVIFSHDVLLSLKRYLLLFYQIVFISFIYLIIMTREDSELILWRGSVLGIIIFSGFTLVEYINWVAEINGRPDLIKVPFFDFTPWTEGGIFLRNTGCSQDPNRGGYLLNIYWFIIAKLNNRMKSLGLFTIFLLILTFSKTAILMFVTMNIILFIQDRKKRYLLRNSLIYGVAVILLLFTIYKITDVYTSHESLDLDLLIQSRFEISEGSSGGTHLALIKRAYETALESEKNFLVGNGFGASYNILLEFFPFALDKLKNFHSTYLTFLAESGAISLLILLIYTFYPVSYNKKFVPVVIGTAVFNIFYQIHLEPMFWFANLMAWFYVSTEAGSGQR